MKKRAIATIKRSVCVGCIFAVFVSLPVLTGGCETRAKTGTAVGAGIGALAGQAIGGSTQATLIGAAVGAGAGYLIGNKQDKEAAKEHDYTQPTALTGTKWQIISLTMKDKPEYTTMTVEFKPDGKVVTTRHEPGGTMTVTEERYRLVADTLIIHKTDYIINATYKIDGNDMTVTCDRFKAVLKRIG